MANFICAPPQQERSDAYQSRLKSRTDRRAYSSDHYAHSPRDSGERHRFETRACIARRTGDSLGSKIPLTCAPAAPAFPWTALPQHGFHPVPFGVSMTAIIDRTVAGWSSPNTCRRIRNTFRPAATLAPVSRASRGSRQFRQCPTKHGLPARRRLPPSTARVTRRSATYFWCLSATVTARQRWATLRHR